MSNPENVVVELNASHERICVLLGAVDDLDGQIAELQAEVRRLGIVAIHSGDQGMTIKHVHDTEKENERLVGEMKELRAEYRRSALMEDQNERLRTQIYTLQTAAVGPAEIGRLEQLGHQLAMALDTSRGQWVHSINRTICESALTAWRKEKIRQQDCGVAGGETVQVASSRVGKSHPHVEGGAEVAQERMTASEIVGKTAAQAVMDKLVKDNRELREKMERIGRIEFVIHAQGHAQKVGAVADFIEGLKID